MISVIMPVYNVEEILLRKSIESILTQDRRNLELLLIDDGSTDDSGTICDEYAEKDARIKVYHTINKGVSAARNFGLDHATGNYIFFVDADDYVAPNCLSKMYAVLEETSADVVMCAAVHVEEDNMVDASVVVHSENRIKMNQKEAVEALCYMSQPYEGYEFGAVWGCLYKREVLHQKCFNEKMKIGEDFAFKFQVFQRIKSVVCLEEKLYYYLIRSSSAMRNGFDERKVESIFELENAIQTGLVRGIYQQCYVSRMINIAIVILFMIPIDKKNAEIRGSIKAIIKSYRKVVIHNEMTRQKVRLALIASYLSIDFSQRVFSILK